MWVQSDNRTGTVGAGTARDWLGIPLYLVSGSLHMIFLCGLVWASSMHGSLRVLI